MGSENPELPVDTAVSASLAEDEAAKRKQAEIDAMDAQHEEARQRHDERMQTKWHGTETGVDETSLSLMRQAVQNGEMDPGDYFLKTSRLFAEAGFGFGKGRIYAGARQSMESGNRENELNGPGINVNAPGLDRWHNMNPDGRPAAPSRLGSESPLSSGPSMQVKPPWANTGRSDVSKIQTPIQPSQRPMTLVKSDSNISQKGFRQNWNGTTDDKYRVNEGTVSVKSPISLPVKPERPYDIPEVPARRREI